MLKKKRIHDFHVAEISLVDGPAILKPICVVKALGETPVKTEKREKMEDGMDPATTPEVEGETTTTSVAPVHEALMQEKIAAIKRAGALVATAADALDSTKEKKDALWNSIWTLQDVIWSLRDLSPILATKALDLKEKATAKSDECAALDAVASCMAQLRQDVRAKSQPKESTVAEIETKTEKSLSERLSTEEGQKALANEAEAAGFDVTIVPKADPRLKALEARLKALEDTNGALATKVAEQEKALAAAGNGGATTQQAAADTTTEDRTKSKDPQDKYKGSALDRNARFAR